MGLQGVWTEFQAQLLLAAYIAVGCFCIWVIWKRSFVAGFVGLLGMSIFILFLQRPQMLVTIGQWLGGLLGIN